MVSHMSEQRSDGFDTIVAGLDIRELPMDGKVVLADGNAGSEFTTELVRTQAAVAPQSLRADTELSEQDAARLDRVINMLLIRGGAGMILGDFVAVNGKGVVTLDNPHADDLANPHVLRHDQNLFGKLHGVNYNDYLYVPHILDFPDDFEGRVKPRKGSGLVMVLGDTTVCSADSYGPPELRYEYALVPLPEDSLVVYKAEIL
jgi:hypothetical protein